MQHVRNRFERNEYRLKQYNNIPQGQKNMKLLNIKKTTCYLSPLK